MVAADYADVLQTTSQKCYHASKGRIRIAILPENKALTGK